jgi:multicomponent Na+:H+ antiporter subunit G
LNDMIVLILAALGALLLLVSAVGTVRLQGVQQRMQAASVGTALGITLLLLSAGIHFIASAEMGLMILLIIFFAVTSPIATTAMARAAYRRLPHSTHAYLRYDDMDNPAYTPDYKAREADKQVRANVTPTQADTENPAAHTAKS